MDNVLSSTDSAVQPLIILGLYFKQTGLYEIQAEVSNIETCAEGEYFL